MKAYWSAEGKLERGRQWECGRQRERGRLRRMGRH